MNPGDAYWSVIAPVVDSVSIYAGPDVFFYGFSQITAAQKVLLAAHWAQSEIHNGGLHQFFFNSTGVLAPEAADAFRALGLEKCADIITSAMQFFGPTYPRDRAIRVALLDKYTEDHGLDADPFEQLDDEIYDELENTGAFETAADRYATGD